MSTPPKILLQLIRKLSTASMSDSKFRLLVYGLILIVVCALTLADFLTDLGTDYGVYFSHGWFMTKGLVPYLDFWTHKAPLLVMILAGWISIFGQYFYSAVAFPILVLVVASSVVYVLSSALSASRAASAFASLVFAFFASSHLLDPGRNGIVLLVAIIFEMLAVVGVLTGLRKESRWHLLLSGVLVFLAFATRQTGAMTYVALIVLVFVVRGRTGFGRSVREVLTMSTGCVLAASAFLLYFILSQIPLSAVWDQIYLFNLKYAAGYDMKLTWWISGWIDRFQQAGLYLLGVGILSFSLILILNVLNKKSLIDSEWILVLLLCSHLVAIYLSRKVQPFYLIALLPEACIMTAFALTNVFEKKNDRTAFSDAGRHGKIFAVAAAFLMLLLPLKQEVIHTLDLVQEARKASVFFEPKNLRANVIAREIQMVAPRGDERIWVFGASMDAIYPFANRLPAMTVTNTARIVYVLSPNDFKAWYDEFLEKRPEVVVSFYGLAYAERYEHDPLERSSGRSAENILKLRELVTSTMHKVNWELESPEIYVQKSTGDERD